MKNKRNKILLGVDLEEFDIPEEYGQFVPIEKKLHVSLDGLIPLYQLLASHGLKATFFTTAYWAVHFPDWIRELGKRHEIASHSFYHSSFNKEDLALSRKVLHHISGQEITGLRMPRMKKADA